MLRLLSLLLLLPLAAMAQDRPSTILVLDGSGSMWGQIDGVNKIVIARDAVNDILEDFPADQALGLTVYGHRTRGDCSDIETVIAPAPGTAGAIRDYLATLNPRDRTPMTDSVIAAAEALRSTEEAATVILVSDGIETCNPDPCAAARILEETGVDFTAHVIGFDVSGEADAVAQMQCIADETGGLFLTADNADELSAALTRVVQAAREPILGSVLLRAELTDGTPIGDPILWDLVRAGGDTIATEHAGNPARFGGLDLGTYTASAYWTVAESEGRATFTLDGADEMTVVVTFEAPAVPAGITFVATLPDGRVIGDGLVWRLDSADESIESREASFERGLSEGAWQVVALRESDGLEVRQGIIVGADAQLVTLVFPETLPSASLTTFPEAPLGATVPVGWDGPDGAGDHIDVAGPDGTSVNHAWTRDGDPVQLRMPAATGEYVIRYVRGSDRKVLASVPVRILPIEVSVTPPATAVAGSTVEIPWTGPGYVGDFIAVSVPGSDDHVNYAWTRDGSPARLVMPVEPGTYEVRYVLDQDRRVMASAPILVEALAASVTPPGSAAAGATVAVDWTGPDYPSDYIAVAIPGEDGYINYAYTRDGSPAMLTMPTEPGSYELRYVVSQDSTVAATAPIEVDAIAVTLSAPATALAGSAVPVDWSGPDYASDYIAVAVPGEEGHVNYTYTREGSPALVVMPVRPGTYELRYVLSQGSTTAATAMIEVSAVKATLQAPATAAAGSTVMVDWDGPDYPGDFIGVGVPGDEAYVNYTYTREGSPSAVVLPVEPGAYELRYYLSQGNTIIGTAMIEATAIAVGLVAPASGPAGGTVLVGWDGPDYQGDYIAVGRVDDPTGYESYTYTRDGNPLEVRLPEAPGSYEIRYVLSQRNTPIAAIPFTVE